MRPSADGPTKAIAPVSKLTRRTFIAAAAGTSAAYGLGLLSSEPTSAAQSPSPLTHISRPAQGRQLAMFCISAGSHSDFNALPSVEDASEAVTPHIEEFLKEAGPLAKNCGLHEYFGAALLHRHTTISDDQVMLQGVEQLSDGRMAMVTRPVLKDRESMLPSTFMLLDRGTVVAVPLEFSELPLVREAYEALMLSGGFIHEYYSCLRKHGLERQIGLSAMMGNSIPFTADDLLVESTDEKTGVNYVVAQHKSELDQSTLLITTWPFVDLAQVRCKRMKFCNAYKRCVKRSPGHAIERGHRPYNHTVTGALSYSQTTA